MRTTLGLLFLFVVSCAASVARPPKAGYCESPPYQIKDWYLIAMAEKDHRVCGKYQTQLEDNCIMQTVLCADECGDLKPIAAPAVICIKGTTPHGSGPDEPTL